MIAFAADDAHIIAAKDAVGRIEDAILFPIMTFMMAIAVLVFLWGMYEYVLNADEQSAHETARTHMMWGIIGFVVMISAYAILKIAAGTFGVEVPK